MRSKLLSLAAGVVAFLTVSSQLFAHHGTTGYDTTNPITVKGTVTNFEFVNPHVQIYFDVKSDKGQAEHWGIETGGPALLVRMGWNSKLIKPGDEIVATCFRAKSGANNLFGCTKLVRSGEDIPMPKVGNSNYADR